MCGISMLDVPSWVPDWSVPLGSLPLPLRNIQRYFDVPWWAEPVFVQPKKPVSRDGTRPKSLVKYKITPLPQHSAEAERSRKLRLRRLEIAAEGSGIVKDIEEIPPHFTFHNISSAQKEQLRGLLRRNDFVLGVEDERCASPNDPRYSTKQPDALQQGEIITERHMKQWLVQELKAGASEPLYQAAASTRATVMVGESRQSLVTKGIMWDVVEICHESFVEDIETDFGNATRFMVAVGCCKSLAVSSECATSRYPTLSQTLAAFWSTLFVGQWKDTSSEDASHNQPCHLDWLPEIPESWQATRPLATAKTTGLVDLAEHVEALQKVIYNLNTNCDDSTPIMLLKGNPELNEHLIPCHDDHHIALLDQLGSMWCKQPYDLYHRPFCLLNTVPDPYWETRKQEDELAQRQTRERRMSLLVSAVNCGTDTLSSEDIRQHSRDLQEILRQSPSLLPQSTLDPGIEKFALGRRFFITKKGYFGLGPSQTESGDRIAVLFGSGVPFLLRKKATKSGKQAWKVVGECYIHGIMDGEVIKQWELGVVEACTILLC